MKKNDEKDQSTSFHHGEVAMHDQLGIADKMYLRGKKLIRSFMPDQHQEFFSLLNFIILGVVDSEGNPWAIIRTGKPGFLKTPDDKTLEIEAFPTMGEPPNLNLDRGDKIGIVGVQLETRRRNRLNGTIKCSDPEFLSIQVDQSFGNCAKYIQTRKSTLTNPIFEKKHPTEISKKLNQYHINLIERADTFFIATRNSKLDEDPRNGLDVNHRGGEPGFIKILDDTTLTFPDFKGNNFYNSMGNIRLDSRVGFLFIDFMKADLLYLSGNAKIKTNFKHQDQTFERSTCFEIKKVIFSKKNLPLEFEFMD